MQTRFNSTIEIKIAECIDCGHDRPIYSSGRCEFCYKMHRFKENAKRKKEIHVTDELRTKVESNNAELNRWFKERRKEMTGFCLHCKKASCKNDEKYFKFSIAHLLPKAYFPSIATHPDNWLELCFWDNSCHTQYDNKMLDITELNCFDQAIIKFQKIYPFIAPKERKRIPDVLLQYIGTDF